MKRWLEAQIAREIDGASGVVVVLDPDSVLTPADVEDIAERIEVANVSGWLELRRLWDLDVRRRSGKSSVAVLVAGPEFETPSDVPWEIEHEASTVVRVRFPVPLELRPLFQVAGDHADRLADAAAQHRSPIKAVAAAYDIRVGTITDELAAIARLRMDPTTPPELWHFLVQLFETPLAQQIANDGGGLTALQAAWGEWLRDGAAASQAKDLAAAAGPLVALLGSGFISPAPATAPELPNWVSIGSLSPDPSLLIDELLEACPSSPTSFASWIEVASWWGQLRSAIAAQATPPDSATHAWTIWDGLDLQFLAWLKSSYGGSLLSAASIPKAVHQIASFLSRRVDAGASIALVVLDGLGFTQWHQLRLACQLKVLEATGCLAMIPTLTSISRQAIFAGELPVDFSDMLSTTSTEPKHWARFWEKQGLAGPNIEYFKTVGGGVEDVPIMRGKAVGIVVNAVDEMLHGAEVLGDRQVAAGVDLWARAGFLDALVATAVGQGREVWITSDHGNIQAGPAPVPKEGQTVESAGTRVRMYPNEVLRQAAAEFGEIWDPPGYPKGKPCPLFARGRTGFHSTVTRVSHGGLSLDEVIVPFVQVTV